MSHVASVIRRACKCVMDSLPGDVRSVLNGVKCLPADLGHTPDGRKIQGCASNDGKTFWLDWDTIERFVLQGDDGELENLICHECAHCYRALTGQADADRAREERGAVRLFKSWGFREKRRTQV